MAWVPACAWTHPVPLRLWVIQFCPGFRFRKQTLHLGRNCSFPAKDREYMESVGECLSCSLFIAVGMRNHYRVILIKLKYACFLATASFSRLPCLYFAVIWGGFWWAHSVAHWAPWLPNPRVPSHWSSASGDALLIRLSGALLSLTTSLSFLPSLLPTLAKKHSVQQSGFSWKYFSLHLSQNP